MKIIVRAYNKDGYHKDILSMNEDQILMNEGRVKEPSMQDGLIGHGGLIRIADFPEMTQFEIVVRNFK